MQTNVSEDKINSNYTKYKNIFSTLVDHGWQIMLLKRTTVEQYSGNFN